MSLVSTSFWDKAVTKNNSSISQDKLGFVSKAIFLLLEMVYHRLLQLLGE